MQVSVKPANGFGRFRDNGEIQCKKRLAIFPSQAGMSLTSLVSDIPARDWNIANLFIQCTVEPNDH